VSHEQVSIRTRDGDCPAHVFRPDGLGAWPAAIFYMDGLGIRPTLFEMGQRLADCLGYSSPISGLDTALVTSECDRSFPAPDWHPPSILAFRAMVALVGCPMSLVHIVSRCQRTSV
jgi:hypothetical protein